MISRARSSAALARVSASSTSLPVCSVADGVVLGGLAREPLLLDREHAAGLGDLAVGGGAGLLDLAGRAEAHVLGVLLGGELDLGGLALGLRAQVLGVGERVGVHRLGVLEQLLALLLELGDGAAAHLLGLVVGRRRAPCSASSSAFLTSSSASRIARVRTSSASCSARPSSWAAWLPSPV